MPKTPTFHKEKLKNGLRFIHVPLETTETVLAMVLVGTGADYESKAENGLAHFLEHMCFKGTAKRPNAKGIALEFDNIGADYNAFTGRSHTGYYARAHKKHASKIIEMVSDIYLNSTFPEAEIEKEKGVIIQEINMYMDDPQFRVSRLATVQLYGDQPAGREIAGTKETVSSFTRKDIVRYYDDQYSAKNTVVVIAGNIKRTQAKSQVEKLFKGLNPGKVAKRPITKVNQDKPNVALEFRETDQTHLILTFRAMGYLDKRNPAARSLAMALGSGMSSRLFQKMREELGICYYINAGLHARHDVGEFVITAGVANDRVNEALEGIIDELKNVSKNGIEQAELEKVKEGRLSSLVLHLETTEDYADFYAKQEILKGKIELPKDRIKEIEGVTLKSVNTLAKDIFSPEKANLAVLGPFSESKKKEFMKILSSLS
ncbi:MAG TPA: pitrilysin family protein [Candidatus Paceibacterota bacterium]